MRQSMRLLPVLFFVLMACNSDAGKKKEKVPDTVAVVEKKPPVLLASYSGVTPCPDCDGIEVNITLMDNNTYTKRDLYMGRKSTGAGSNEISSAGTFEMRGDTLRLQGVIEGADLFLKTDS